MTRERPILDQLNVVVSDMEASVAFYRRLGCEFDGMPAPWGDHHRPMKTADGLDFDLDSAGFAKVWDEGWSEVNGRVVIGFRLTTRDTVDALYADLTGAGYRGHQSPFDAWWGARYAIVLDPDGNPVGLMSPSDPTRRTEPPGLPQA